MTAPGSAAGVVPVKPTSRVTVPVWIFAAMTMAVTARTSVITIAARKTFERLRSRM